MRDMKFIASVALVGSVVLGGCANFGRSSAHYDSDLPFIFDNFADIPVPDRMTMNMRETRIYGREMEWTGTISFSSPYDLNGIFDFYIFEMPRFGWLEITSVRANYSVMSFIRDRRVALIQISQRRFGGTDIRFTISPAPPGIRSANSPDAIAAGALRATARTTTGISPMHQPVTTPTAPVPVQSPAPRYVPEFDETPVPPFGW